MSTERPQDTRPLPAADRLIYSTVRIACEYADGTSGSGTGFLFAFVDPEDAEKHLPVIVTNRHVVEGTSVGRLVFHPADAQGLPRPTEHWCAEITEFEEIWIDHPDGHIDLCVAPLVPIVQPALDSGVIPYLIRLDESLVPTQEYLADLVAIEDVVMIGYPTGIADELNNLPIVRRGITATHPGVDYDGRSEFLIDAACFPGSSGSPVFLYNQGSFAARSGGLAIGNRVMLLGVLYAGPVYGVDGTAVIEKVPTRNTVRTMTETPQNLGLVIKAGALRDFGPLLRRMEPDSNTS